MFQLTAHPMREGINKTPETTINQRIKRLITWEGKQKDFARITKIPASTLSSIVSTRKVKPDLDTIEKILKAYPSVSAEWLHTGRGSMLLSEARPVPMLFEPPSEYPSKAKEATEDEMIKRILKPLQDDLDRLEAEKERIREVIRRLKGGFL